MHEKTKGLLIGSLTGMLGVVVGAAATGAVNYLTLEKQHRQQAVLDSFKFDVGDYPREVFDLKIFVDQTRNFSTASSDQIARLAAIRRKYPNCTGVEKECLAAFVEEIQANRKEMGVGEASSEDIEILMKGYFSKMQKAAKALND
jgi:uncharacterized protein YutD